MARDFFDEWNALVDEANNLVLKLSDDDDLDDINDWHKMVLIKRDLMWLRDLVIYEMNLDFIEQLISRAISDNEKFEVARVHYIATKRGKSSIDWILDDCKRFTIHAGYAGYFTEKVRRFVEDVKDSFFSDSEESED
ncbi:hypothetical protein [Mitsuokella sp. AF21-1AC]|uniref:hypothetical protein n=1 Tax=Mitsuokella sp. AF21-1AC TaxID=2292235 RepID=UPI000E52C0FD|nr:hypothetical protein [Mitsuokella sp. AF21-1AC]RGS72638.1 hypothetical protein DWX75_05820 [Mitsuokella sp. AF21-1AC]